MAISSKNKKPSSYKKRAYVNSFIHSSYLSSFTLAGIGTVQLSVAEASMGQSLHLSG
jgi:hypothetical protein